MNRLMIERFAYFEDRTLGIAHFDGLKWYTIENPWKDNAPNVSCIPTGTYDLIRVDSPKYGGGTWEIADVPGRTHILIHKANWATDVLGCVGFGVGLFAHLEGVTNSARAVGQFYEATKGIYSMPVDITDSVIRE